MDDETKAFWFGAFITLLIIMLANAIGCMSKHDKIRDEYLPYDKIVEYRYTYKTEEDKAAKVAEINKLINESEMVLDSVKTEWFNRNPGDDSTRKNYIIMRAQKRTVVPKEEEKQKDD